MNYHTDNLKIQPPLKFLSMTKLGLHNPGVNNVSRFCTKEFLLASSLNLIQPTTVSNMLLLLFRSEGNRAYSLKLGPASLPVYCHMSSLGACGGGGWTLVMKIDGTKVP